MYQCFINLVVSFSFLCAVSSSVLFCLLFFVKHFVTMFQKSAISTAILSVILSYDPALCHSFWREGELMLVQLVRSGTQHAEKRSSSLRLFGLNHVMQKLCQTTEQKHCHIVWECGCMCTWPPSFPIKYYKCICFFYHIWTLCAIPLYLIVEINYCTT